jgi:two-component system heavy metal sensor histidine kinase CusS
VIRATGQAGHSISQRLSLQIALLTMVVLGAIFTALWFSVAMLMKERSREEIEFRTEVLTQAVAGAARVGGEAAILSKMESMASMRAGTWLELRRADGSLLYVDADAPAHRPAPAHEVRQRFRIEAPGVAGGFVSGFLVCDVEQNVRLGQRWALILVVATLISGAIVAAGAWWRARRLLQPLRELAAQTRAISPQRLDHRLALADPAEELQPWITQFNALMTRVEQAYAQLEGFNADVAHELRTPIAALMGHVEVALSRERPAAELRETMALSLEELQQMSGLIDDMLFLSHADRGARARRSTPRSLRPLAEQVVEYHEGVLDEAGVRAEVVGQAQLAVDEALVRRALSNLLANAARYAERGSTVRVSIEMPAVASDCDPRVRIAVENRGATIDPQLLPRLFDRFFRAELARSACQEHHHGLGLAIVAAVARMHGGGTFAASSEGVTCIGFELCGEAAAPASPPGGAARAATHEDSEGPAPQARLADVPGG